MPLTESPNATPPAAETPDPAAPPTEQSPPRPHFAQLIGTFDGGGAERVAYNLAVGLHDLGVRSTGIALRALGRFPTKRPDVDWLALDARPGCCGKLQTARRLRTWIKQHQPDLLWIHGTGALLVAAAATVGIKPPPRLWFTWHNSENVLSGSGMNRRLMRRAIDRCERVFGPSTAVVDQLAAAGIESAKLSVFINGVEPLPPTDGLDADLPLIVWAGRLGPLKDPIALVNAAAKLRDQGLRFRIIIAGSATPPLAWYEKQLHQRIDELGLRDIIETPGWVEDVGSLYAHAAIGVQTSHTEGLSMTLLEQMTAGLAIVATDVGDTNVAIEHERTGLIVRPKDLAGLVDALDRVISDTNLRRRLAHAARQEAMQRFTCQAMAEVALGQYEQCMSQVPTQ